MRKIYKCDSPDCLRLFQSNSFDGALHPGHPTGVRVCPHCGKQMPGREGRVYLTHNITDSPEESGKG